MVYQAQMPSLDELEKVYGNVAESPAAVADLVARAKSIGCSRDVVDFINLFSNSRVFENRKAFLDECVVLERMIQQERESPPEILKNP